MSAARAPTSVKVGNAGVAELGDDGKHDNGQQPSLGFTMRQSVAYAAGAAPTATTNSNYYNVDRVAPTKTNAKKIACAAYDYVPDDSTTIAMRAGDYMKVFEEDESGWWYGLNVRTGERGLFPATYVEVVPDEYLPAEQQQKVPVNSGGIVSPSMDQIRPELQDPSKLKKSFFSKSLKSQTIGSLKTTKYGVYGSNMVRLNGFATALMAIGCFVITSQAASSPNNLVISQNQQISFVISFFVGGGTFLFEALFDGRSGNKIPLRGLFYCLCSVPCFFSNYLTFNGIIYLISAIFHFFGAFRGELGSPRFNFEAEKKSKSAWRPDNWFCFPFELLARRWNQGKGGKDMFTIIFISLNVILFLYGEVTIAEQVTNGSLTQFTHYVPWAKAFGYTLDFLGAVIVLPVCRTFIRQLYDLSTQNQSSSARCIRAVLWLFPLDRALHFHERVGWMILFCSFGHSFAHLINAALRWDQVLAFYGWSPLLSGFLLWLVIFFMFPAVSPSVKRGQFEIFWYTHQLFWLFFLLNIIHGKGTIGPNYWKAFVVPGTLYIFERIYREYSAYQTVRILSVTNMQNKVLSIEFAAEAFPTGYLEGQYCFIMSPHVSKGQWHPFTISSAPGDPTVTVHIKIQGRDSWTGKVLEYLSFMGPKDASYFEFQDAGPKGIVQGKTLGITGERILLVYGPHSAPTQHIPEYNVGVVIGSGIGVTPVSACMQQTVFHRWRYDVGETNPSHAYFIWICNYKEMQYFRWMIRTIKECQDEVHALRTRAGHAMNSKTFEVHIYVTSVPEQLEIEDTKVEDDIGFWGRPGKHTGGHLEKPPAVVSEMDIYQMMINPQDGGQQIEDIFIFKGRPDWGTMFGALVGRHPVGKHGVAFCGSPLIGADLKGTCENFSNAAGGLTFTLHKENF